MTNASAMTHHQPNPIPSKMFLAIGFFLSTLVTTGLTTLGGAVLADRQVTRTEQLQRIDTFTKTSSEFPALVRDYSTALIERRDPKVPITKLQQNIVNQLSSLGDAENGLSRAAVQDAENYRKTLADVQDLLDAARTAETSGPILQPLVNAVEQREVVVAELRDSAGLKTKPRDPD